MNKHNECCTEQCGSGLRNNYFEGKRITPDSFRVEQKYLLERRRLLNRAIHGWGVVYGYELKNGVPAGLDGPRRLGIGAGLALDECGRELLHTDKHVELNDIIVLDENEDRIGPDDAFLQREPPPGLECWLLSVHYAERPVGLVKVKDPCECDYDEWDHTCETVRFSLRRISCDDCCRDFDCELDCECGTGSCCQEDTRGEYSQEDTRGEYSQKDTRGEYSRDERQVAAATHKRGGCRCLCDHLAKLQPGNECDCLYEIEESCGTVRVDLRHGVPLACVGLAMDDCKRWSFNKVEACGPRRLVKRNDLLFDLIRGCDLTRISEIGWADWHRREEPVTFEDFSNGLGPIGSKEKEYITGKFWVRFSRAVREDTLRPDCFAMTIMSSEERDGWWQADRVPIIRVDTTGFTDPGDPAGHVRGARIVVDGSWVEDGVRGRKSLFLDDKTRIEFEIRGDFIVDCNGQTVDANARGLSPAPSGNGSPGDTFLSTFLVAAAGKEEPYDIRKK
jgi:hypothetical protein